MSRYDLGNAHRRHVSERWRTIGGNVFTVSRTAKIWNTNTMLNSLLFYVYLRY